MEEHLPEERQSQLLRGVSRCQWEPSDGSADSYIWGESRQEPLLPHEDGHYSTVGDWKRAQFLHSSNSQLLGTPPEPENSQPGSGLSSQVGLEVCAGKSGERSKVGPRTLVFILRNAGLYNILQ